MVKFLAFSALILISVRAFPQSLLQNSHISGNFQSDFQYYYADSLIGAPEVPEKFLMNGFMNLQYTNGNFSAGVRYESYQNVMQGYDKRLKGNGITYRYAEYRHKDFEITAGNFYEQFGSGILLRTYEERTLGIDNSLDGFRIKVKPFNGVLIKAVIGTQRLFFDQGPGIVRGVDGEISLNDFFKNWNAKKVRYTLGGSFVSKYQEDKDNLYILPENVGAWSARASLSTGKLFLNTEYAYKINDPSSDNGMIYKPGQAFVLTGTYSVKGFGLLLAAKRIDNMSFRSDRAGKLTELMINYLPVLNRQHAYALPSYYPYSTQPNGEMGYQAQLNYKLKKNTLLGGKYGTDLAINYSRSVSIKKTAPSDTSLIGVAGTLGYSSNFFELGDVLNFEDVNIEFTHKFSKKVKMNFMHSYISYNAFVMEQHGGMVYAHASVLDVTYKFTDKKSLRIESQHLLTKQDDGNWALLLLEFSVAPSWYFAVMDNYNYGNSIKENQLHYYLVSTGYTKGSSRFAVSFGKQREGITCVGGVCRNVPASYGFLFTVTSSF